MHAGSDLARRWAERRDDTVVVPAPGPGPGNWAGAPSATSHRGTVFLAYRVRRPPAEGRGGSNVVARVTAGTRVEPIVELDKARFGAESLDRPALVVTPQGGWRLYVSCATPGSKHWRVDLLEAAVPEDLAEATPRTVLAGDATYGIKDPVVLW